MSTIVFAVLMAICFAGLVGTIGYLFGVRGGIKLGKDYQRLKDKEEGSVTRPASTNDIKLLNSKMEETCQGKVFDVKNKTNYEDIIVLAELKKQFEEEDTTEEPTENEFDKIVGYMVRDLAENADCGWLGGEYRSTQYFVDRYKEKLRNAILNENKEK